MLMSPVYLVDVKKKTKKAALTVIRLGSSATEHEIWIPFSQAPGLDDICEGYQRIRRLMVADWFLKKLNILEDEEGKKRENRQQPTPDPRGPALRIPPHYKELYLLPGAPKEVVKSAYKALCMLHHPDRGGDGERVKRINASKDRIFGEKGWDR